MRGCFQDFGHQKTLAKLRSHQTVGMRTIRFTPVISPASKGFEVARVLADIRLGDVRFNHVFEMPDVTPACFCVTRTLELLSVLFIHILCVVQFLCVMREFLCRQLFFLLFSLRPHQHNSHRARCLSFENDDQHDELIFAMCNEMDVMSFCF